ncbi:MAG: DUF1295 domain-containing protein [Janthinobacterium lividum]
MSSVATHLGLDAALTAAVSWAGTGIAASCIWLAMAIVMTLAWASVQRSGKSGWIDVCWTFGLGVVGVAAALWWPHAATETAAAPLAQIAPRRWLAALLLALWSLRLGTHIMRRTLRHGDDPRYARLREEWGDSQAWRMFAFLQVQALAGVPLLLAVRLAAARPDVLGDWRDYLAGLVCLLAIGGEALADRQLRAFGHTPQRQQAVCDVGLWRWSRHPNYFFEWMNWLTWPLMALDLAYAEGWLTLLAPLLMYGLLAHGSGVPPLEAHMARSRGAAWRAYAARTSVFFPWPPKRTPAAPLGPTTKPPADAQRPS